MAAAKSDLIVFDGMIHQLFLSDIPYTINTFIELVVLSKNRNPCLFAMTCWSLWNRRKKVRMNEVVLAMERLFDQAVQLLQEFQNAHPAQPKAVHPVRPPWKSLDPSELKTNFDEAVFDDLNSAGIGVVVRNSQGDIMAALSEQIPMPSSVLMLETLAARRAVLFIHELGFNSSSFECDSEVSINALRHKT